MKTPNTLRARAVHLVLFATACGREPGVVDPVKRNGVAEASALDAADQAWVVQCNLGPLVNSASVENGPEMSKDGLSLYFASTRSGGVGSNDLYVSRRSRTDEPWSEPVNLGPSLNSDRIESGPHLSRDGHWLYFASDRAGGAGSLDIWVAYRQHTHDDLGWEPATNLGSLINTDVPEAGPSAGETEFYFARGSGPGTPGPAGQPADIYVSFARGETFSEPQPVDELNSPALDQRPNISFDGREIILGSDRPGGFGREDIWASMRAGDGQPWNPPVNLGEAVNTSSRETTASLSKDGALLFFASDRTGSIGNLDLYVATRRGATREEAGCPR